MLDKFVNGVVAQEWQLDGVEFTLDEDWSMELGAIGSNISAKVWKASEPEPVTQQLSIIDSDIPTGTIGLTAAMSPGAATQPIILNSYYDDVIFTVPEPKVGLIPVFLLLMMAARSKHRCRRQH